MARKTDTMSLTELASYLGRDRSTVYRWIKAGYISSRRDGLSPISPIIVDRTEADRVKKLLDAGLPL